MKRILQARAERADFLHMRATADLNKAKERSRHQQQQLQSAGIMPYTWPCSQWGKAVFLHLQATAELSKLKEGSRHQQRHMLQLQSAGIMPYF